MSDNTSDGTNDEAVPDGNPQPGTPPPPPYNPRLDLITDMNDPDYRMSDDHPEYRMPDGSRPPSHRKPRHQRLSRWLRGRARTP